VNSVLNKCRPIGQVEEICQWETMEGRCHWRSEVIVMTSARWGRMKTGRCLDIHPNALAALGHDPLFLGCSEDVLSIMDRKCSGHTSCDVRIPDPVLDEIKPCYPDQTRYLEASYICVKGLHYDEILICSPPSNKPRYELHPLCLSVRLSVPRLLVMKLYLKPKVH